MKSEITVVILTYNESIHIERSINNVSGWADKIIILDSYSEDDTVEKAKLLGAEVIFRKFDDYKKQREFAIEYCKDQAEWMFFLDADEYLTEELKVEIKQAIKNKKINGFHIPRRFIFMNKWIKWGGYYPIYLLRLFRPEYASLSGSVNEHVVITGATQTLQNDFVDHNLKGIDNWINKHNRYATYEAGELLNFKMNQEAKSHLKFFSTQSERKQWLRFRVWNKLPIIIRPFIYFIYRYIVRLGFLDGKVGFIYHFIQGFWYWVLIDTKYFEMEKKVEH